MTRKAGQILTAVLVDYDNIYLALRRKNEDAAKRFAKDAGAWLRAIEGGQIITPTNSQFDDDTPRRIVLNRCYGNPVPRRNTHDNSTDMYSFPFVRHHFLRAGFEVVDCPPLTAQLKNSSDIRMVMDVRDFLLHDTYFDEFIILSGDADFTPVLHRLRAHARRTVIFANDHTAAPYKAISDGEVREVDLIQHLIDGGKQTIAAPAAAPAINKSETAAQIEGPRRAILAEVISAVHAASAPIPIDVLADRIVRTLGQEQTIGTEWAGAGSFRDLLSATLPEGIRISDQPPYHVIDTRRQLASESASALAAELRPLPTEPALITLPEPAMSASATTSLAAEPMSTAQPIPAAPAFAPPATPAPALAPAALAPAPLPAAALPIQPPPIPAAPSYQQTIAASAADFFRSVAQVPSPAPSSAFDALTGRAAGSLLSPPPLAPPAAAQFQPAPPIPAQPAAQTLPQAPMAPPSPPMAAAQRIPIQLGVPPPQQQPASPTSSAQALQQSIARIHEACQAPPLSPPEYRILFDVMAREISERGLAGSQTLTNIVQRAQQLGLEIRRDDVRFVLEVVSETDPWFEQGASPTLFAGRFRNFVVARCRSQGLNLSADELDLIEAWFVAGAPQPAAQPAAAPTYGRQPQVQDPRQSDPARGGYGPQGYGAGLQPPAAGQAPSLQTPTDEEFPRIVRTRLRG